LLKLSNIIITEDADFCGILFIYKKYICVIK